MEIVEGSIVRSIAGRDKGSLFIVISREGDYVYLANGELRKVDRPKRKKLKHLQGTKSVSEFVQNKLAAVGKVTNSEVRKALAEFN
ncbi:MAG: RNA-binding protein [Clostridia bacterium]|jgi:ribosomal protein L14E/L6E/L27E|nr:RNA-binding protein [Clostridia bacterium]NDO18427.1 RNA-binding protein [Lachnospiraceae bacterium MD329]